MRANLFPIVLLSLATLSACGPAADEPVLAQFFAAARLRDHTALARIATVVFEPNADGMVTEFKLIDATPERQATAIPDVVELSLKGRETERTAVDVVSKDLTVDAQVRQFDGNSAQKTLMVTLQRAVSKDRRVVGRWIVTGIRQV